MIMYTGDLKPDLQITLSNDDPAGVNIDDADSVRIIGRRSGVIVFDRAPTSTEVVGQASVVRMEFEPTDTDIAGRIHLEVEVMWPGAKPQTFTPDDCIDVQEDFDH